MTHATQTFGSDSFDAFLFKIHMPLPTLKATQGVWEAVALGLGCYLSLNGLCNLCL